MTTRDAATEAADPTDELAATPVTDDAGTPDDTAKTNGTATTGDATTADDSDAVPDSGETTTPEGDPTPAAGGRRGRRRAKRAARTSTATRSPRRRWPLVALLVVAALFAGAMVTLFLVNRPDPIAGLSRSQQDAVTAAGQAAVNLQTFRRASFDEDFANALASLTPQFAQEQLAPRKDALQKQLTDGGRDATARALSSALVSSTSTQAVVLVVTNTTQTADDGTSTPFVFSRLQLSLQLVDGKWLVSDLKSVGLS